MLEMRRRSKWAGILLASVLGGCLPFAAAEEPLPPLQGAGWSEQTFFELPPRPDPVLLAELLERLEQQGIDPADQGLWFETAWGEQAAHRSTVPRSAASLTKIATTYAALQRWGAERRFSTRVAATGAIVDGVVAGDLVVSGPDNLLFVWEEAIAVGNALAARGIREVRGDLIVVPGFAMNFREGDRAARELRLALDARTWTPRIAAVHREMPPQTPKPEIAVRGTVRVAAAPRGTQPLLTHESLPLAQILKVMNVYSNNAIADRLGDRLGGGPTLAAIAATATGLPTGEIQLIDGSGLGPENQMSPRMAVALLRAIERDFGGAGLTLADLFPVAQLDPVGTLVERELPAGVTAKTGTLWNVSSLAGKIPAADPEKSVYFAILNQSPRILAYRAWQDEAVSAYAPANLTPLPMSVSAMPQLGDPQRIR